jgi:hypothetical protein
MALHPGLFLRTVEIVIICIEYYEKEMEGEG